MKQKAKTSKIIKIIISLNMYYGNLFLKYFKYISNISLQDILKIS